MKKVILSVCLSSSFVFAQSVDYVPFSKISENKKKEYNFVNSQKKKESIVKTTKEVKKTVPIKRETIEQPVRKIVKKKNRIRVVPKKKMPITKKVVARTQMNPKEKEQETTSYNRAILLSAEAEVSFFTADYSSNTLNGSNTNLTISPKFELIDNKHKVKLQYFQASDDISNVDINTKWYKLGYRYNYKNSNIGFDINRITLSRSNLKEFLPSLEVDMQNKLNQFVLNYGGSIGTNGDVDTYEYFLNIGYEKKFDLNNTSFNLGYKNKTIKTDNAELDYTGPFISVKTVF